MTETRAYVKRTMGWTGWACTRRIIVRMLPMGVKKIPCQQNFTTNYGLRMHMRDAHNSRVCLKRRKR